MPFDFKKAYRELYLPKDVPAVISVPKMAYLAVRGSGDPNQKDGAYQNAVRLLYAAAYTLRMSGKGTHRIEGFFDYVMPPLEGFWEQKGISGVDYGRKADFCWISAVRLPDFVKEADFRWALDATAEKKKLDVSGLEYLTMEEGLCVQCMHIGPYDAEPATVQRMHAFMEREGYALDITEKRLHHEIYLSDPAKTAPEKLKTVIRHPIRRKKDG